MSGNKFDDGKVSLEILSVYALPEIAKALQHGKGKYGEWNYRGGFKWTRLCGSLLRHIYAWIRRENKDPETGLSHLAHAGANVIMLLDHEILKLGEDDRWKPQKDQKEEWPLFPRMQK